MNKRRFLLLVFLGALIAVSGCTNDDDCIQCVPEPVAADDGADALDLQLLTPVRAAIIRDGEADLEPITVGGRVCDPDRGIVSVIVNGLEADFDPAMDCSDFEVELPILHGLGLIEAIVTTMDGGRELRAQSYMRSRDWRGGVLAPWEEGRVRQAVMIHLRQDLLDDGDRSLPANDLATVLELALAQMDLAAGMPTVIHDDINETSYDCGLWTEYNHTGDRVSRTGAVTYSSVTIDNIFIADGYLDVDASVHDLHLPIKVFHYGDEKCLGDWERTYYGTVDVDRMAISTELFVHTDDFGELVLDSRNTTATPHGYSYEIDRFLDLFEGRVAANVKAGLEESGPVFQDLINEQLRQALSLFELPGRVDLPAPLSMTVLLETAWDHIYFHSRDGGPSYMQLTSAVRVRPEAETPTHAGAPGSLEIGGLPPELASDTPKFAMGLKDDLLNQMLWAAWVGGAFDLDDISAANGISQLTGLSISTVASLPPVIMAGSEPGRMRAGIGDLYGELPLTQEVMDRAVTQKSDGAGRAACAVEEGVVGAWFSMIQEGELFLDAATGKFAFTPTAAPEVVVEVKGLEDPYCAAILGNYIKETIGSSLPAVLKTAIESFPSPHFSTDLVPGGLSWGLQEFEFSRLGNYECAQGDLTDVVAPGGQ